MESDLEIPIISYEGIRNSADNFLKQYHPSRDIPIPIEEIIEFQMRKDIIPLIGLHQSFEVYGFTSSDLSSIYVDEFVYKSRPGRYRFTLAHEVGHIVLHKEIYQKAKFQGIKEWKDFINSISDDKHSWLEYQSYAFGGLVLVPHEHLEKLTQSYVKFVRENKISLKENWDYVWDRIAAKLAKDFGVSTQVVEKRLGKDKIQEKYI
ncbi:MAG: hypothetical protein SCARUB_00626 [Candidatus Scalindua rubra]|uniref:IrrE N-terminal-like domain-containing protein n=1 Tax=Candidatus Scalindua rubra TaxID=1872076 RepID=A0A1E3XF41_9BACT|nr:MAG: hypothetical protein SCARUB_00626 [Candidatus Scalindua rubra]